MDSLVDLRCGEKYMFQGRMGRRGANMAICIEEKLIKGDGS